MTNLKTVKEQKENLINSIVNFKIEGFDIEYLQTEDLQGLQEIYDEHSFYANDKVKKDPNSIHLNVMNYCIKKEIKSLGLNDLIFLIRKNNLKGYFNIPDNYKVVSIARTKRDAVKNVIQSNKDDISNKDRLDYWLNRSKPFINSHLTSKTSKVNLFNSKESTHYFTYDKTNQMYNVTKK